MEKSNIEKTASEVFFENLEAVKKGLEMQDYISNPEIDTVVFLAKKLGKPVLVEGPAGVGKTELAKVVATAIGVKKEDFIRLQCYEGLDEAKALYEWNYQKQLLRIQSNNIAAGENKLYWDDVKQNIFSDEFLLPRPLLKALRSENQVVLLIDEIDKTDEEFEAFLLEILSDFQVSVPELGTISAKNKPLVFLTSNAYRQLSDALKRRCLHLYIDYPTLELEREIVLKKVKGIDKNLADKLCSFVQNVRNLEWLKKKPSISETLDWAQALLALGAEKLDRNVVQQTLSVILKFREDVERVSGNIQQLLGSKTVVVQKKKEDEYEEEDYDDQDQNDDDNDQEDNSYCCQNCGQTIELDEPGICPECAYEEYKNQELEKIGTFLQTNPTCSHCGTTIVQNELKISCPTCGWVSEKYYSFCAAAHETEIENGKKAKCSHCDFSRSLTGDEKNTIDGFLAEFEL